MKKLKKKEKIQMEKRMFESSNNYLFIPISEYFSEKIKGFKRLPKGWNRGDGVPPDDRTIYESIEIANYAYNNFLLIDSVPGLDGEIQIVLYHQKTKEQQYIELTFESNNYNITHFENKNKKWKIIKDYNVKSLKDIKNEIDKFIREMVLWKSTLESYPKNNFIATSEDLEVLLLKTLEVAFPSSKSHAFQTPEYQYATI
ncbi:MAG: hypothetical protein Q8P24_04620 [Desulfobacterales bacterium]|nr:hypothetical protein [Desulfobacterales bacterium]